jgi:hypothetical protein
MPQLLTQEPTPAAAFEVAFPPFDIISINISFVIDELPWCAIFVANDALCSCPAMRFFRFVEKPM